MSFPRWGAPLLLAFVIGCSGATAQAIPSAAGAWSVNSDPAPPVVGAPTGLFFEYVPTPGIRGPADPLAGRPPKVVASCSSCGGVTVEAMASAYPSLAPAELYDTRATAAYSVRLTLPRSGLWSIAPFGVIVTVRDVDDFEPPLVHVNRWSDPFDPGCGRREVAALVSQFVDAYNAGDGVRLAALVQQSINFSIAGGAVPFVATDRAAFLAGAATRHRAGERLTVSRIQVASNKGSPNMAIYGARTADDLPAGGQRLVGKAAMWCTQQQFIHLNLGAY